jgi:hypothetical protein
MKLKRGVLLLPGNLSRWRGSQQTDRPTDRAATLVIPLTATANSVTYELRSAKAEEHGGIVCARNKIFFIGLSGFTGWSTVAVCRRNPHCAFDRKFMLFQDPSNTKVLQTQLARLTGLHLVGSEWSSSGFNISMITASFQTNGSAFSLRRRLVRETNTHSLSSNTCTRILPRDSQVTSVCQQTIVYTGN